MSDQLKPCPFCGMPASLTYSGCTYRPHCEHCEVGLGAYGRLEDAVKDWNRRSDPALLREALELLETIRRNVVLDLDSKIDNLLAKAGKEEGP